MTSPEPDDAHLSLEDALLLEDIKRLYTQVDPVPPDLADRVRFAMQVASEAERVLRVREEEEALAGVRGGERSRTITFDSVRLTVMIDLTSLGGGLIRMDGWLAPPADHVIELRTATGTTIVRADGQGRFAFERVNGGMTQLVVRRADDPRGILAITPSIDL
ncbi:carboxypeptidase regulatory-like domain-containing protein [Planobispora takensis]|uniref:Carboxypeptidase regulatory-like domain-containing protein n=1 Tax=Planobispora takensis TaxID=1367882 RepID=A0A8J3WWN8_9ACTN|nr:carboxypeptidase regulatory-like domain-containing protein [Planobispora takensis]GII02062.1 hypothetical protein Pta02_40700 [Planobispora takensis]